MRQQIVQEINDLLNHMEDTGKVDMSILDNLKKLRQFLSEIKSKWLDHPDTDAFYFYQAARNVELILVKMEDRFRNSKVTNDNPKIAKDSLSLMPAIDNILTMTETNEISDAAINSVLAKTRQLRNTAASTNLIEPIEVDKDSLRSHFTQLMNNLEIKSADKYKVVDV